jgi:hypothetical protein
MTNQPKIASSDNLEPPRFEDPILVDRNEEQAGPRGVHEPFPVEIEPAEPRGVLEP